VSIWADHNVEERTVEVLQDVPLVNEAHHFGRPYMSAYQLAIELDDRYPDIRQALGYEIGGAGTGQHGSFAQYIARQLSGRIRDEPDYPVEGAFMSNVNVDTLRYRRSNGELLTSSLTGSGYDLSMFRLRVQASG
jgi:hypothetical protein